MNVSEYVSCVDFPCPDVRQCSRLLETEISLFCRTRAFLLMVDVAI